VRRGASQIEIGVLEGTVEVFGEREPQAVKRVHGGQQLVARGGGELGEPQSAGPLQPGSWRKGQRLYIDAPLREIVADANRYSPQSVELADESLGELKVSVSFRAENQQQMLNSLQLALPLTVERPAPDRIVLRAAPK
jgi:transmembrane sensor